MITDINKRKAGRFLRVAQYVPRTVIIAIKTMGNKQK